MARSLALGNAYTGLAEGIEALHFNPAGIGTIKKWDLGLAHIVYPLQVRYSYIGVASRFNPRLVTALTLSYLGSEDEIRDAAGASGGQFTNFDVALAASAAYDLSPELTSGGTIRFITSELGGFRANTFGLDLGLKYQLPFARDVSLGAAIKNIGPGLQYVSTSSPQPWEVRVGAAWKPSRGKFLVSSDVSMNREAQPRFGLGTEYRLLDQFLLRAGFDITSNTNFTRALKLGAGFRSKIGSWDYAYETQDEVGQTHRFSYSYFGAMTPKADAGDTSIFLREQSPRARSRVTSVYIDRFANLSRDGNLDWLSEGFRSIFLDKFKSDRELILTPSHYEARYIVEGQYLRLEDAALWVGVKIVDARSGELVDFVEARIEQNDLIRATTTVAGAVMVKFPR